MSFISLTPLQDELAIGFAGRFCAFNALDTLAHTFKALRAANKKSIKESKLAALARANSLDVERFTHTHSMLPLYRAVTTYVGHRDERRVEQSVAVLQGLQGLRDSAMLCSRCVEIEMEELGFSYWHRRHHFPGVDWCSKHNLPLMYAPKSAYSAQPWSVLQTAKPAPKVHIDLEMQNPTLQRLAEVQKHWLETTDRVHAAAFSSVLKERCKELDLRLGQGGKRPVLSDLARTALPPSWMERHLPLLLNKRAGEFLHKLDGTVTDRHVAYPSFACALAIAVLFESTDLAFELLKKANLPYQNTKLSLNKSVTSSAVETAMTAFLKGIDLIDACKQNNANQSDVEQLLRTSVKNKANNTTKNLTKPAILV